MTWPDDADGEVMRRLSATGFNFDAPTTIDFNIDFDAWPPGAEAIEGLATQFSDFSVETDYVLVRVRALVTYDSSPTSIKSSSKPAAPKNAPWI